MQVRNMFFMLVCLTTVVVAGAGCAYTKKEVVQAPCVIADKVLYADVVPILQANCYSCHATGSNSSGILLNNYNALKSYAQNGFLYGTISHASGYRPMPDNGGKLSDCNIALIKKWIDNGTPQ